MSAKKGGPQASERTVKPIRGSFDSGVRINLAYGENPARGEDALRLTDKELLARGIEIVEDVDHRNASERPGGERAELLPEIADLEPWPGPDWECECRRFGKSNALGIVVDADDIAPRGVAGKREREESVSRPEIQHPPPRGEGGCHAGVRSQDRAQPEEAPH